MNVSLALLRTLFLLLSVFFMTLFMVSSQEGSHWHNGLIGIAIGCGFSILLFVFDKLFRKFNLRAFNIAIIGIFIGYLMGQALVLVFDAIIDISSLTISFQPQGLEIIKIAFFLFGTYLGTLMTLRAADELYISIPFVKFAPTLQKKKDLLIDGSTLSDTRILDLAGLGLLDHQLIIPRFLVKELYAQAESSDEVNRAKAKRALEVIKKLEHLPHLELRFNETDFPEVKDMSLKLIRLARLLDANILTADISRVQSPPIENLNVINMHALANALKPLMQTGEYIKIKIQRKGKEPRQGVGYLEDGTMVVVNGGGDFIGEQIDAQVLSVKHTSSGRMIFCNSLNEEGNSHENGFQAEDDEHR